MWHRHFAFAALLVLPTCLVAGERPAIAKSTFWVATDGSDAWSGRLARPNADRSDGPFATLHRARDAVRTLIAQGLAEPATITVRGGVYRLAEPLALGPEDSGTAPCPVTWQAAAGERVTLSGGRPITGWKTDDGKLWHADLPKGVDWGFRQLFVNGRREPRARFPNLDTTDILRKGWLYARTTRPVIVAGLAKPGNWLEYRAAVPVAATYTLWLGYATVQEASHEHVALSLDGKPLPLPPIPTTGGWRSVRFVRVGVRELAAGEHRIRIERTAMAPEHRIHLDAFVLTDNAAYTPQPGRLDDPPAGERRIVVEAEDEMARVSGRAGIAEFQGFRTFTCADRKLLSPHTIHVRREDIHEAWGRAPDAEVHLFAAWGWFNEIVRLAAIDRDTSTLTLEGRECQGKVWAGNRFFVAGVREELDQPGEWFLDRAAGRLLYWPRKGSPADAKIVAPVLDRLVHLRAPVEGKARVRHVVLRGFHFRHTRYTVGHTAVRSATDAAVHLDNAHHCAIEACTFALTGGYAVRLHLDSCHNRIAGNEVNDAGAGGVILTSAILSYGKRLDDREAAQQFAPLANTISRNHIHHSGVVRKYVAGVQLDSRPRHLADGPGNIVAHNHIHHMPRNGIFGFMHQCGNTVEGNLIHDVLLESDDGGGIHFATSNPDAPGNIICGNVIRHVLGPRAQADGSIKRMFGFGIYLDNATSNCLVTHNTVSRTSTGGVFLHIGCDNIVENNIVVGDVHQQLLVQGPVGKQVGNRIRRNLFVATDPDAKIIKISKGNFGALAECDGNLYWAAGRPLAFGPVGTLAEWRAKGFDRHSVVADPQFVDPEAGDFRLRPTSPAHKLGFKPVGAPLLP